jgi:uncharacterized membrane protein YqjE
MSAPDRPFSEVLKSIFGNVEDMIRGELKLAATQAREEFAHTIRGAAWFAVGIVTALFTLGFVLLAIFFALLPLVPNWAAALIIAGGLALISIIAFGIGAGKRKSIQESKTKPLQHEELPWARPQVR